MFSFKDFITESTLTPAELYKYGWRVDLFLSKFKGMKPFLLKDKKTEVVLIYDANTDNQIRNKIDTKKISFRDVNGVSYKLSDFLKSAEFGGGGGSGAGAGAALTKLMESSQAVYCQARWMGNSAYSPNEIAAAFDSANVDETLANIQNELNDVYKKSCIICAEALYKKFGSKHFTFVRGDKFVKRLEKKFTELNKVDKKFSNLNKWSPADIYMVSAVGKSIDFSSATNFIDLNNILIKAFDNKDIIGVSLKLVKNNVKIENVNIGEKKDSDINFIDYTTGTRGFFNTKDIYLSFSQGGKIQFRTFSAFSYQGEIKGKNANHGKISYGPINSILKSLKMPQLTDNKKVKSLLNENDETLLKHFYSLYSQYASDSIKVSLAEFREILITKELDWKYAKYISCQLIDIIKSNHIENTFISACVQYASSSSDLSAPFIKVY